MANRILVTVCVGLVTPIICGCSGGDKPATPTASAATQPATPGPAKTSSAPTASLPAPQSQLAAPENVVASKATPAETTPAPAKTTKKRRGKVVKRPEVFLSEQHAASCLLQVDQAMPDLELVDTAGSPKNLSSFLGTGATVVCFWDADNALSNWQMADLGPDVAEAFSGRGVSVVAINRGQSRQQAQEEANRAGITFPVLVDEDGRAYGQLATRYLPRTYVLDASGKVVWFDLEYSLATRRDLNQAILAALAANR